MKNSKEKRLNDFYSDCCSEEGAVEELIYLTNKSRGKYTTESNLRKCYYERTLGSLLKRLDIVAFNCAD